MITPDKTRHVLRPGVDWWYCTPCDEWWLEDGKGILTMPAECGPCGKPMTLIGGCGDVSALREEADNYQAAAERSRYRQALAAALEFTRRPDQLDATALSQLRSILAAGLNA